jgi:CTP:molybdopterin cytidylyltransferase MocA
MPMPVAAIVLAAGASRRLGQPKQLLMHGNETLLERAIRLAREAGASPVVVVLGAHIHIIRASIPFKNAVSVVNNHWEQGISTSIHAGLRTLEEAAPDATGALLLSCDQPRLTSAHLRALIESFTAQGAAAIAASAYAGVLGVPAVFPRAVFPDLLALRGDTGARTLFAEPPCPLKTVEFAGGEVDIDLPADLDDLK